MVLGLPEDEPLIDTETGEALEIMDYGEDISQLGAADDATVLELQGIDTKSRRRFTEREAQKRLEPKSSRNPDTQSELDKDPFNMF